MSLLKDQLLKARKVEDIRHEMTTYEKVLNVNKRHPRVSFFIRAPHVLTN